MKQDFDIAVVGGGLAGLALSIQCVDAGYQTILFEKETYPFHKVCGEYISNESLPFLEKIGVPISSWGLSNINELKISAPNGNAYQFSLPLGGFGVSRYKLDEYLYRIALSKGVTVMTGTKVHDIIFKKDGFEIKTDEGVYYSKLAAGSFGKRSNLDIHMSRPFAKAKPNALNNFIGVKYHIRYLHPINQIALHNFNNGYCGIEAIENGDCCLCYLTTAENLKKSGNSIPSLEQNILWKNPLLKDIFRNAEFIYKKPFTISQVSFEKKSQIEDHLLCVGDAAGMITPLCGNGMSMALHGSKIAFQNIDYYFKNQQDRAVLESDYEQQWKKQFANRIFAGRTLQRLFGNEHMTNYFLQFMQNFPALSSKLINATHGKPF
ncbi:MAG: FAD-binding protein [Bacteroidetes bacterium]|nr:FAD-binding protein [Bacteroidota bacterium]